MKLIVSLIFLLLLLVVYCLSATTKTREQFTNADCDTISANLFAQQSGSVAPPSSSDLIDNAIARANAMQSYSKVPNVNNIDENTDPKNLPIVLIREWQTGVPLPGDVRKFEDPSAPWVVIVYQGDQEAAIASKLFEIKNVSEFMSAMGPKLKLNFLVKQKVAIYLGFDEHHNVSLNLPFRPTASSPVGGIGSAGLLLSGNASVIDSGLIIHELMHALFSQTPPGGPTKTFGDCMYNPEKRPVNTVMWGEGMAVFINYHWNTGRAIGPFYKSLEDFAYHNASKSHLPIDGIVLMSNFDAVVESNKGIADAVARSNNCYAVLQKVEAMYGSRYAYTCFYYYVTLAYGIEAFVALNYEMGQYPSQVETVSSILKVDASDFMGQYVADLMTLKYLSKGTSISEWSQFATNTSQLSWRGFLIFRASTILGSKNQSSVSWQIGNNSKDFRIIHMRSSSFVKTHRGDSTNPIDVSVGDYVAVSAGGHDRSPDQPSITFI